MKSYTLPFSSVPSTSSVRLDLGYPKSLQGTSWRRIRIGLNERPTETQGLGSRAKIGIGLGVPIAVIVFVFAGFLGYHYHVRKVHTGRAAPELVHDVIRAQEVAEKEHAPEVEEMALERRH